MQEQSQESFEGTGGGERSEPEPGPSTRRPRPARGGKWRRHRYTPEERRAAVEAYLRGGGTQDEVSAAFGVSLESLRTWLRVYRRSGPKGLEGVIVGQGLKRGRKPLAPELAEQIVATKRSYPDFGLRKVRDYLARFMGLRVSAGGVRSVLRRAGVPPTEPPRRRGRRREIVRRFERSRPGELWQSDITSFVLARESRRVYLIVFLDDFSRYVVAWGLHVHQRQEVAIEALLEGIARFGKPREVLTDQGRQYYAWRGKSDFQKLLVREGMEHVVSRAHHPETLGKCERLWETVGRELWDRVHPADLAEARERLGHYFAYYNHFRPHQGIDGMVPADRFFGAESEVRAAIETSITANELRLALGEAPRHPVYLVGRVGDEVVSVHGERGRVVVSVNGQRSEMGLNELGMEVHGDDGDSGGSKGAAGDEEAAARAGVEVGAAGTSDQGDLGRGERGGAQEGAGSDDGAPGILAGAAEQERAGEEAERAADPRVADEPAGDGGDGGGDAEAAERETRADAEAGPGGEGLAQADRAARARERAADATDPTAADDAGQRAPRAPEGGAACREAAEEGGGTARSGTGRGTSCGNVDAATSPASRGCSA
jgi:transposase InsO family protein